jgi:hypothetical protein
MVQTRGQFKTIPCHNLLVSVMARSSSIPRIGDWLIVSSFRSKMSRCIWAPVKSGSDFGKLQVFYRSQIQHFRYYMWRSRGELSISHAIWIRIDVFEAFRRCKLYENEQADDLLLISYSAIFQGTVVFPSCPYSHRKSILCLKSFIIFWVWS